MKAILANLRFLTILQRYWIGVRWRRHRPCMERSIENSNVRTFRQRRSADLDSSDVCRVCLRPQQKQMEHAKTNVAEDHDGQQHTINDFFCLARKQTKKTKTYRGAKCETLSIPSMTESLTRIVFSYCNVLMSASSYSRNKRSISCMACS